MALFPVLLQLLCISVALGRVSMDFSRKNQHVTIDRDGTDVDVRFGDIMRVNGRRMSYIGNKQWIGENSAGHWDYGSTQEMPASYFLTVRQFKRTGKRLGEADIAQLKKMLRKWTDTWDSQQKQMATGAQALRVLGEAVQAFLIVFAGIVAAVVSFGVAVCVGYVAWDRTLKWAAQNGTESDAMMKNGEDSDESECGSEMVNLKVDDELDV